MFDMIAGRYDAINRVLAMGMDISWRKRMVAVIQATRPERILDMATGTADVSLLLSRAMPEVQIVGIDPSNNMLDVGREKIRKEGRDDRIVLQWGDARDLSAVSAESFDAATMAFGIRNVPERDVALCEINRLLKTGSRFCILEFSEPDDSFGLLGATARLFIRHVIPFLGGILSGAPREYWHLQKSIKNFPAPAVFRQQIDALECGAGSFHVDEVEQMCFGSVQLYIISVDHPPPPPVEEELAESPGMDEEQTEELEEAPQDD